MNKIDRKNKKLKFSIYLLGLLLAAVTVFAVLDRLPAFWENFTGTSEGITEQQSKGKIDLTVLVNSDNEYAEAPPELVSVYDYKTGSYFVKDKNVLLNKQAVLALNEMMDGFYSQTGLKTVNVISGYRSVAVQEEIYRKNILSKGRTYTEKYVQKPGYSEHHTGLAIDLAIFHSENGTSEDFDGEGEYRWITENAYKYGFIVRYPPNKAEITGIEYEPWHFRYVGVKAAKYITKHNLCLEEYVRLYVLK